MSYFALDFTLPADASATKVVDASDQTPVNASEVRLLVTPA